MGIPKGSLRDPHVIPTPSTPRNVRYPYATEPQNTRPRGPSPAPFPSSKSKQNRKLSESDSFLFCFDLIFMLLVIFLCAPPPEPPISMLFTVVGGRSCGPAAVEIFSVRRIGHALSRTRALVNIETGGAGGPDVRARNERF